MNKHDNRPYATGYAGQENCEQSGSNFLKIEIMDTEGTEQDCEQCADSAAFAFRTGSIEGIVGGIAVAIIVTIVIAVVAVGILERWRSVDRLAVATIAADDGIILNLFSAVRTFFTYAFRGFMVYGL